MTQEEKDLLLKDLSARLPYGVIVAYKNQENKDGCVKLGYGNIGYVDELGRGWWTVCKPYLRPMSSVTKDEKDYFDQSLDLFYAEAYNEEIFCATKMIDFFNEHHLDYRGLIENGLALEAPKDMYKSE